MKVERGERDREMYMSMRNSYSSRDMIINKCKMMFNGTTRIRNKKAYIIIDFYIVRYCCC